MAALATLPTTTLAQAIGKDTNPVSFSSVTNIVPGKSLFVDGELMKVVRVAGTAVTVLRGQDGSATKGHAALATVYIGRGDQFYVVDPIGAPETNVEVAPWINTVNGNVWWPEGDGSGSGNRYWQLAVISRGVGPLGVATATVNPSITGVVS